jgi:hypothetical protein
VTSGVEDLLILKSTDSGFAGYLKDKFTTLPETNDRILATKLCGRWTYLRKPKSYSMTNTAILEAMLDVFLINGGKGLKAAELDPEDHPICGQLMGSHPDEIALGAKVLVQLGYDVIDVNLACPVKKIRKKARGGHLLQEPGDAIAGTGAHTRDENDGQTGSVLGSQGVQDLVAADARKADLEADERRRLVRHDRKRLLAARRLESRVAPAVECGCEHAAGFGVLVDHQHRFARP